ncbi:hypothetical protein LINPERHAP1_LOCUS35169 [Linum perenne]
MSKVTQISEEQILKFMGANTSLTPLQEKDHLEDEDLGFAYISQHKAHPSLYSLIGLWEHIKKRPPLAMTEKVQQLVRALLAAARGGGLQLALSSTEEDDGGKADVAAASPHSAIDYCYDYDYDYDYDDYDYDYDDYDYDSFFVNRFSHCLQNCKRMNNKGKTILGSSGNSTGSESSRKRNRTTTPEVILISDDSSPYIDDVDEVTFLPTPKVADEDYMKLAESKKGLSRYILDGSLPMDEILIAHDDKKCNRTALWTLCTDVMLDPNVSYIRSLENFATENFCYDISPLGG